VQVLPGPPPVTRCDVCCKVLQQFNLLSSLMGSTPVSIRCNNSSQGCTCALPIQSSTSSTTQTSIFVAQSKEHARSLLSNRPSHSSCLLLSSRTASGLQSLLKSCTLMHTFPSSDLISLSMNVSSKPSPILVFRVPDDNRDMGSCHVLASAAENVDGLDMIFKGFVHGKAIRYLMDTGASSCFLNQSMVKKLGLVIRPS